MQHLSSIVLSAFLLVPTSALAADPPEPTGETKLTSATTEDGAPPPAPKPVIKDETQAKATENTGEHLRGLEITIRPAFGAATSDSPLRIEPNGKLQGDTGALLGGATPYGTGFVGQAMIGYRFHPLVSGGLRAGLRNASATALNDGSTDLQRASWDAGFYLRAYPLALNEKIRKYIDPWASVGVEYMRDMQEFKRDVATTGGGKVRASWTLDHHAVAIPLGIGVDYRVLPMLSVGPSFEYTLANAVAGCAKTEATGFQTTSYCSNEGVGKDFVRANNYGVWTAALDLKLTVF